MATSYGAGFYAQIERGSADSADVIVPLIMDTVKPRTVVDVGCGRGIWAKRFALAGAAVTGIDGNHEQPLISEFVRADLSEPLPDVGTFDLAVCLEVAEHLPASRAESFVAELTALAPVVLFSAAIPHQSGHGHINCQWQSYWAELFSQFGYGLDLGLRSEIWTDERVEPWYRQNIVIYMRRDGARIESARMLDVVHPVIHGWGRK